MKILEYMNIEKNTGEKSSLEDVDIIIDDFDVDEGELYINENEEDDVHEAIASEEPERSDYKKLEEALSGLANFRYNTIIRRPEIKEKRDKDFRLITEYDLHSLVRTLRHQRRKGATKNNIAELLESNFVKKVNPVEKFFTDLRYNGDDTINALASTVVLADQRFNRIFEICLKKWLVGAVANVFVKDRCANQLCLIIAGKQGTFKSTWLKNLCPKQLEPYYIESGLDPDNKDSIMATATNFIFNLDDYFAGITSKKINEFKGLLTKGTVKVRKAYGRYVEERPKICSFVASSNEATFLHDPTGNRRFLPFEVKAIDINKAQTLSIENAWAQAFQLYTSGFKYWLSGEEQKELNKYVSQFEVQTTEYEILNKYYRSPIDDDNGNELVLTSSELLSKLRDLTGLNLGSKKMGEAIRKLGFPMIWQQDGRKGRFYKVVKRDF